MKNHSTEIFKSVFEDDLRLLHNEHCNNCSAEIKNPLLPWIVGEKYFHSKEKILFVGKPHRGIPGELLPSGIIRQNDILDILLEKSWPYWQYTRLILEKLYGKEDPWDNCSFTNIIKCTNVGAGRKKEGTQDKTSYSMEECCIKKLGVIHKEIEILKPHHIIFYTYSLHRELLNSLDFALTSKEITKSSHHVTCGNQEIGWWDRRVKTKWNDNVKVLVTAHPQFKKKEDFVNLIVNWIRHK